MLIVIALLALVLSPVLVLLLLWKLRTRYSLWAEEVLTLGIAFIEFCVCDLLPDLVWHQKAELSSDRRVTKTLETGHEVSADTGL
jgi:hypothetical protein